MDAVSRLSDIRDLDPVSWWPPAPGWWLVLAGVLLLAFAGYAAWRRWRDRRHRWRRDARLQLVALRRSLRAGDPKAVAGELSQLIRRIAMARCGRAACAGLTGSAWLAWLGAHDPQGFDWPREGRVLLTLPYAPQGSEADRRSLRRLLAALRPWVEVESSAGTALPARGPFWRLRTGTLAQTPPSGSPAKVRQV